MNNNLKEKRLFITGGFSGMHGSYNFIKTGNNLNQLPHSISRNGTMGRNGKDARTCETKALDVSTVSWKHAYVVIFVPVWTLNTDFNTKQIDDPECSDVYVRTDEEVLTPKPRKQLNVTAAINGYMQFLNENSEKATLFKTIRTSIEAIEKDSD